MTCSCHTLAVVVTLLCVLERGHKSWFAWPDDISFCPGILHLPAIRYNIAKVDTEPVCDPLPSSTLQHWVYMALSRLLWRVQQPSLWAC